MEPFPVLMGGDANAPITIMHMASELCRTLTGMASIRMRTCLGQEQHIWTCWQIVHSMEVVDMIEKGQRQAHVSDRYLVVPAVHVPSYISINHRIINTKSLRHPAITLLTGSQKN